MKLKDVKMQLSYSFVFAAHQRGDFTLAQPTNAVAMPSNAPVATPSNAAAATPSNDLCFRTRSSIRHMDMTLYVDKTWYANKIYCFLYY